MIWFDFVSCVLCIMWAMQAANQAGAWVAKRPNSHAHCVFPCCVTPPSRHQVADVWQDMLVNRSWIIYSVIHFTIPSWDCKLLQSCYFKPSFPTWGCRCEWTHLVCLGPVNKKGISVSNGWALIMGLLCTLVKWSNIFSWPLTPVWSFEKHTLLFIIWWKLSALILVSV